MDKNTHRYELALEIGEEAVRRGQWQQAMTCFQTALSGLPKEPRVYNGLGDTYQALADIPRALSFYKEAARLAPDIPDYPDKMANLQAQLEMPESAAQSSITAGDIYWKRQRPDEARERWEHAVSLSSTMVGAHERLALLYRQRGDIGGSIRHHLVLAELLHREGRCLMALHNCYQALSLAPDNPLVWAATEQAWSCVAARRRHDSNNASPVEPGGLVNAAAEFAQWQLTAELHHRITRGANGAAAARYDLLRQAILNEGYNKAGPAIQYYELAIAAGIDMPAAFFALGLLYRLVERPDDAQAALTLAGRHPFYARARELLNQ